MSRNPPSARKDPHRETKIVLSPSMRSNSKLEVTSLKITWRPAQGAKSNHGASHVARRRNGIRAAPTKRVVPETQNFSSRSKESPFLKT